MGLLGLDHSLGDIAADDVELGGLGKGDLVVGVLARPRVWKGDRDLVLLLELRGGFGNLLGVGGLVGEGELVEANGPGGPWFAYREGVMGLDALDGALDAVEEVVSALEGGGIVQAHRVE